MQSVQAGIEKVSVLISGVFMAYIQSRIMTTEKILTVICVFAETKFSDMFPISEFAFNQCNKYIFYIKSEHGNRIFSSIRVDPYGMSKLYESQCTYVRACAPTQHICTIVINFKAIYRGQFWNNWCCKTFKTF
jgi:hypothetical protein